MTSLLMTDIQITSPAHDVTSHIFKHLGNINGRFGIDLRTCIHDYFLPIYIIKC